MKKTVKLTVTVIAVSLLLTIACFTAPGELSPVYYEDYTPLFSEGVYGETALPYRLYVPADPDPERSYPVILSLHGSGSRGTDNLMQICDGLFPYIFSDPELYENVILIAPQCPEEGQWVDQPWSVGIYFTDETPESVYLKDALSLLGEVVEKYNVDRSRLYITGFSMGGYGTWDALVRHPGIFAAAVPICGGADSSKAEILTKTPIHTFHCTGDQVVPFAGTSAVVNAVKAAGGNIQFTEIDSAAHDAWTTAYSDRSLYDWLFTQSLSPTEEAITGNNNTADSTAVINENTESQAETVIDSIVSDETDKVDEINETDKADETDKVDETNETDNSEGTLKNAGSTVAVVVFILAIVVLGCVIYFRRDQFN